MLPVSLCNRCGWIAVRPDLREVDRNLGCRECGAENPTMFVCDACNRRYPFEDAVPAPEPTLRCPICGRGVVAETTQCPECGADLVVEVPIPEPGQARNRRPRRAASDYNESDIEELSWIPGVGRKTAEMLAQHGYSTLSKVKRASEEALATIPGIGPKIAHRIKDALWFMNVLPSKEERAEPAAEEYECPLCGCPTSGAAAYCHDCGLPFAPEDIDDHMRQEADRDPETLLIAHYTERLSRGSTDAHLWYAKALALREQDRLQNALDALDFAIAIDSETPRFQLVRASLLARMGKVDTAADQLRRIVRDRLLELPPEEGAAIAEEVPPKAEAPDTVSAAVEAPEPPAEVRCPRCGQVQEAGTPACVSCGAPLRAEPPAPSPRERRAEPTPESRVLEELEEALFPEPPVPEKPVPEEEARVVAPEPARVPEKVRQVPTSAPPAGPRRSLADAPTGRVRVAKESGPRRARRSSRRLLPRLLAIVAAVVLAVAIGAALIPLPQTSSNPITIDGTFADWAGVPRYVDGTPSGNADVAIQSYAVVVEDVSLSVYVSVRGTAFGDSVGYDGVYAFVDTDGNPATGYRYRSVGADLVLEAYGGVNGVTGVRRYAFREGTLDWNARETLGAARGAARGSEVEIQASFKNVDGTVNPDDVRILLYADDYDGNVSRSTASVGRGYGAIRVTQVPLRSTLASTPDPFLRLDVSALGTIPEGESWVVSGLSLFSSAGVTTSLSAPPISLTASEPTASVIVSAYASGIPVGSVVEVGFAGAATSPVRPVTALGGPARAYFSAAVPEKRVDGLFEDWSADSAADSDVVPPANANVDLDRFGGATANGQAFFFASVSGSMLGGWAVPVRLGPAPASAATGEDILRVYLDTNASDAIGQPVAGITANVLVEITGTDGRVTSRTAYRWSGGWQVDPTAVVVVATGGPSLEGSVVLDPADVSNLTLVVDARDWSGAGDTTAVYATRGTAPGTRGVLGDPVTDTARSDAISVPRPDSSGSIVPSPNLEPVLPIAALVVFVPSFRRGR